jgi:hypothetical protein
VEGVFLALLFEELEEDGMASLRELNPRFEDEGAEMTGSGAVIETTGSGVDVEMTGSGADVETTGSGAGVWVPSCVPR